MDPRTRPRARNFPALLHICVLLGSPSGASPLPQEEPGEELIELSFRRQRTRPMNVDCSRALPLVAIALRDGRVRIFDVGSGEGLALWQAGCRIGDRARFAPDGKLLVTTTNDGTARIWDWKDEREVAVLRPSGPRGYDQLPLRVEFSPDGSRLQLTGLGLPPSLWDTQDWTRVSTLEGLRRNRPRLTWSADGRRLGGVDDRERAIVFDPQTGRRTHGPLEFGRPAAELAFQPCGHLFAVAAHEKRVRIWDLRYPDPVGEIDQTYLFGDVHDITVVFSPTGEQLVTSSGSGYVRCYDVRDWSQVWEFDSGGGNPCTYPVEFIGDGSRLLFRWPMREEIRLLDAGTGKPVEDFQYEESGTLIATADGEALIAIGADGVTVIDAESGRVRYMRVEFLGGDELIITPALYYRGSPDVGLLCKLRIGDAGGSLARFAEVLRDPERVRAAAAGKVLERPRLATEH